MSPLKTALIWSALSVVITAGGLHFFQQGRIREAQHLRSQNNRLLREAHQRVMSRPGAAPAPGAAVTAVSPAGATSDAAPGAPPTTRMAEYYRNEGNATPLATLQTFAWACDQGDVGLVGRLLSIDPAARSKAEAFMAALPESARAQWKTVDEMAAAVLTRSTMAQPFPNADILETATPEPISEDRVKLRMPNVPKDGTEYQKTVDGWKYVVTEEMVDNYIKQTRAQAGAAR